MDLEQIKQILESDRDAAADVKEMEELLDKVLVLSMPMQNSKLTISIIDSMISLKETVKFTLTEGFYLHTQSERIDMQDDFNKAIEYFDNTLEKLQLLKESINKTVKGMH